MYHLSLSPPFYLHDETLFLPIFLTISSSLFIVLTLTHFSLSTEAEETEKTIEEHFTNFGNQMKELSDDLTVKTKDIVEKIGDSEFVTKTRYTPPPPQNITQHEMNWRSTLVL